MGGTLSSFRSCDLSALPIDLQDFSEGQLRILILNMLAVASEEVEQELTAMAG